jgi:hypothetical protein
MFFIIYKTTNLINGKTYTGKHKTKDLDDGYLGSGKILNYAIQKYGKENFHKEILHFCKSEKHMNILEKILVVPDPEINYNLCPGGKGGFGYINASILTVEKRKENGKKYGPVGARKLMELGLGIHAQTPEERKQISKLGVKARIEKYPLGTFKDKKHSEETKSIIGSKNSIKQQGSKNSQFGTMWITNGVESEKLNKNALIPEGWYKGRKLGNK